MGSACISFNSQGVTKHSSGAPFDGGVVQVSVIRFICQAHTRDSVHCYLVYVCFCSSCLFLL